MLKVIPFLDTLVIASVTFFFVKKKIMLPDIFWILSVDQILTSAVISLTSWPKSLGVEMKLMVMLQFSQMNLNILVSVNSKLSGTVCVFKVCM